MEFPGLYVTLHRDLIVQNNELIIKIILLNEKYLLDSYIVCCGFDIKLHIIIKSLMELKLCEQFRKRQVPSYDGMKFTRSIINQWLN